MKLFPLAPAAVATLTLTTLWSCERTFVSCEETLSCEAGSTGSGGDSTTGGASPSGGAKSGGAPGVGGNLGGGGAAESGGTSPGGSPGAGGVMQTCEGQCGGSAPYCDPETFACYECESAGDCFRDAELPLCGGDGACVGCKTDKECQDQEVLPVCLVETGECVSCADENDCMAGGIPHTCDPVSHECTETAARTVALCNECEHDVDCVEGATCIAEQVDPNDETTITGKKVCATLKVAGVACDPGARPFARYRKMTSVDGTLDVEVCVLTAATCGAYLDFKQDYIVGCDGTDAGAVSDDACGYPGIDDGICTKANVPDAEYRCTYPCTGPSDCKNNVACQADIDGDYCALN